MCGLGRVGTGRRGCAAARRRQGAGHGHGAVRVEQRRFQGADGVEANGRQAAGEAERAQRGQLRL